jgi:hypothetical protein
VLGLNGIELIKLGTLNLLIVREQTSFWLGIFDTVSNIGSHWPSVEAPSRKAMFFEVSTDQAYKRNQERRSSHTLQGHNKRVTPD